MTCLNEPLKMWAIYDHPTDYPDKFVARLWHVLASGAVPTSKVVTSDSLAVLQTDMAARSLYRLHRHQFDDPCIVEVWL